MGTLVETEEPRIGVYVCHCGSNIAGVVDTTEIAEYAAGLPNVVLSKESPYACADPGQNMIRQDLLDGKINRVVVAACSVKMHEPTFRAVLESAGVNQFFFEMANVREQDTWVHAHDVPGATAKAKALIAAKVAKARYAAPLDMIKVPVTKNALVIGGGIAGIETVLGLADMGYHTYLVEKEPTIGGVMSQLNKTFPTFDCSI